MSLSYLTKTIACTIDIFLLITAKLSKGISKLNSKCLCADIM